MTPQTAINSAALYRRIAVFNALLDAFEIYYQLDRRCIYFDKNRSARVACDYSELSYNFLQHRPPLADGCCASIIAVYTLMAGV
jgi:hypothetical protein